MKSELTINIEIREGEVLTLTEEEAKALKSALLKYFPEPVITLPAPTNPAPDPQPWPWIPQSPWTTPVGPYDDPSFPTYPQVWYHMNPGTSRGTE